jgi:hypothetical protein
MLLMRRVEHFKSTVTTLLPTSILLASLAPEAQDLLIFSETRRNLELYQLELETVAMPCLRKAARRRD